MPRSRSGFADDRFLTALFESPTEPIITKKERVVCLLYRETGADSDKRYHGYVRLKSGGSSRALRCILDCPEAVFRPVDLHWSELLQVYRQEPFVEIGTFRRPGREKTRKDSWYAKSTPEDINRSMSRFHDNTLYKTVATREIPSVYWFYGSDHDHALSTAKEMFPSAYITKGRKWWGDYNANPDVIIECLKRKTYSPVELLGLLSPSPGPVPTKAGWTLLVAKNMVIITDKPVIDFFGDPNSEYTTLLRIRVTEEREFQ